MANSRERTDILVVGSGLAGLWFALKASKWGRVALITKDVVTESNTQYAQGGIAAAVAEEDTPGLHAGDTLAAGGGLCRPATVELVTQEGPALVRELASLGVPFSRHQDGGLDLGREGGHGMRRIVHAADRTGSAIEGTLVKAVRNESNITIVERAFAVDLIMASKMSATTTQDEEACFGAYVLLEDGSVTPFEAKVTVLSSGGAGKIYRYTSNPNVATGDGMAMAYRAGARVSNLEFVQFHPTSLYHPEARSFLITEALRGEGATLENDRGHRFMLEHDSRGELAPRDIVARGIDQEIKTSGAKHVWLNTAQLGESFLLKRFPQIMDGCRRVGIDPAKHRIPVVPAAHYLCGGVRTDLRGRSDIPRLYAIGEVAHTGLHGANRLASNSLLEALVFAEQAASDVQQWMESDVIPPADPWVWPTTGYAREDVIIHHNWSSLRSLMWDYVGIVRVSERLEEAKARWQLIQREVDRFYRRFAVDQDLLELRNITLLSGALIEMARSRRESRGLHYNKDFDGPDERFRRDSILARLGDVSWGETIEPHGSEVKA